MKKSIFIFVIFLIFNFQKGNAQIGKGSFIVSGTGGVNYETREDDDNLFRISISSGVAKLLTDKFAIGGGLGMTYQELSNRNSRFVTNISPNARYYFTGFEKNPAFYLRGQIGLAVIQDKINDFKETESGLLTSIGLGMSYFVTENVSLDTLLAYSRIGGKIKTTNFGLNIGFQIFLNKKE